MKKMLSCYNKFCYKMSFLLTRPHTHTIMDIRNIKRCNIMKHESMSSLWIPK